MVVLVLQLSFHRYFGSEYLRLSMDKPAIDTPLAVSSSIEPTYLALIVRRQLFLLPMKELAIASGKAAPRGSVILANTSSLGRRWSLAGHLYVKR
jgi:hypothetical protein